VKPRRCRVATQKSAWVRSAGIHHLVLHRHGYSLTASGWRVKGTISGRPRRAAHMSCPPSGLGLTSHTTRYDCSFTIHTLSSTVLLTTIKRSSLSRDSLIPGHKPTLSGFLSFVPCSCPADCLVPPQVTSTRSWSCLRCEAILGRL
jgi:hypothetical protein